MCVIGLRWSREEENGSVGANSGCRDNVGSIWEREKREGALDDECSMLGGVVSQTYGARTKGQGLKSHTKENKR